MGIIGFLLTFVAGLVGGYAPVTVKFMRRFGYEHWGLVSSFVGYLALPWAALFLLCPDVPGSLADVPLRPFLVGNAFSTVWGVANVLYCICLTRIGFSLTQGFIVGLAIPAGVVTPMILKGSGVFADSPGPLSRSGLVILTGVALMLAGVILLSKAGFGRETAQKSRDGGDAVAQRRNGFLPGLVMCVIAGVISIGISFSFVYTQGTISAAFRAHGASEANALTAVRIVTLPGGALVNMLYPVYLLCKNHTWGVFAGPGSRRELLLSLPIGIVTVGCIAMTSVGMAFLGALGPSVGFGVNQGMQIVGSQSVGLLFGEWRGVPRRHVRTMLVAAVLLLVAVGVIAYGNTVR